MNIQNKGDSVQQGFTQAPFIAKIQKLQQHYICWLGRSQTLQMPQLLSHLQIALQTHPTSASFSKSRRALGVPSLEQVAEALGSPQKFLMYREKFHHITEK